MKEILLSAVLTMALSMPAMAGTDYNICFGKIDGDYDGEMTEAEFRDAFPNGDLAVLKSADADKNGTVSHEEWEDYKAAQGFGEKDHTD